VQICESFDFYFTFQVKNIIWTNWLF